MTPQELRARAREEADELGPKPEDPRERELWAEERRGAVVLLASLADWDASQLRRAALEVAGEWVDPMTRDLLLDATQEGRKRPRFPPAGTGAATSRSLRESGLPLVSP